LKKLLTILILFSITCKSQDGALLHNIFGQAISIGVSQTIFTITKYRIGVSLTVGLASAATVGYLKEEYYDKRWHNGTYSKIDMFNTAWGGVVGCVISIPIMAKRIDKAYKKEEGLPIEQRIFLPDSLIEIPKPVKP
jgi:hypothetical protein